MKKLFILIAVVMFAGAAHAYDVSTSTVSATGVEDAYMWDILGDGYHVYPSTAVPTWIETSSGTWNFTNGMYSLTATEEYKDVQAQEMETYFSSIPPTKDEIHDQVISDLGAVIIDQGSIMAEMSQLIVNQQIIIDSMTVIIEDYEVQISSNEARIEALEQ